MRRLLLLAAVLVALSLTAITYAAGRTLTVVPAPARAAAPTVAVLVVPDVTRMAFVFAKSQLQDAGFAWRVVGRVQGYPANTVVSQSPAAGTRLVDTGSPLITLTLRQNGQYRSSGEPENTSPYAGTKNRLAGSE